MQLTQARIEEMRNTYVSVKCYEDWPLDRDENIELCNMALRLAAIEGAGDEEVEKLRLRFQAMSFVAQKLEVFDELAHAFKSRGQEVADLRAKLGEATERIQDLEDGIEAARLGL